MAKLPKAIQLFRLIEKAEVAALRQQLIQHKRNRLADLTNALATFKADTFGEKEKAWIYEKIFDNSYSNDKDYLLRNEFRLLSQQIEWLLALRQMEASFEKNDTIFHYHLLQALQERKALELFQKEYKNSYRQAIEHQDYYAAHNIAELNFLNFTQFLNLKESDVEYLEKINELRLTHLSCYYLSVFRKYQVDHFYIHNDLFPFSTEETHLQEKVAVNFTPYETDYSDYLLLKAKSFIVPPEQQVEILHQCLEKAEHHLKSNDALFAKEIQFCWSALGKAYSQKGEFQTANDCFKKTLDFHTQKDHPEHLSVLSNYIANQINLNAFQNAVELLEENKSFVQEIPKMKLRWLCLQTACYALMDNTPVLEKCLEQSLAYTDTNTKHFFRFYYAILACREQRNEDAYREMENLRHLTTSTQKGLNIHPIVNLFHRFFYTLTHHLVGSQHYETNLQHLRSDVEEFALSSSPEIRSYLPFLWLKKELEIK